MLSAPPGGFASISVENLQDKIRNYLAYNKQRKIRAINFNEAKATILFKLVPFLLHCNYPDLPGFLDDEGCCYGIWMLNPDTLINIDLFRKYFPTSTALNQNTPSPYPSKTYIHSLKTIGSIGTMAQSDMSDCDYWISLRKEEIGTKGFALLEQKCQLIEEWAMAREMEIHFFLMDIDQTRDNNFEAEADKESAGSALKILLKDELFRTHILVAGKLLLWWLIPPGLSEEQYRKYVQELKSHQGIKAENFIDLGYMSDIPHAEIFGACLWQMNKALDSPFKSVIKFAYLERLLKEEEDKKALPLFSDKVKCLVTFPEKLTNENEKIPLSEVDPYMLMARDLVAFYQLQNSEQKRANLLRECFFLKAMGSVQSSTPKNKQAQKEQAHRFKKSMNIMKNWHLLPGNYEHYLYLRTWHYKDMVAFGARVHDYLIETYKSLRWIFKTFQKEQDVAITERDIAVLGRKLFTFYEKKPNKVEYIRGISPEIMAQDDITFHIARFKGKDHYYAFQGHHDNASIKDKADMIIKRENQPVNLIVWLIANGILSKKTRLHLTKNFLPISLVDLQHLVEELFRNFPPINFAHISGNQLLQQEKIIKAMVVVNLYRLPVKNSKNLYTTVIYINSYGEYFVEHFTTLTQLKNFLRVLLTRHYVSRWNNNLEIFIPPQNEQHYIKSMIFQ